MLAPMLALPVTLAIGACTPADPGSTDAAGTIAVEVVAGPVCPVERDPPDPKCEPRPVEGARVLIQPGDGRDIVVGEATTGADGRASVELPPGDYIVVGVAIEGLMGLPPPATVRVEAGETSAVTLAYDTGIR